MTTNEIITVIYLAAISGARVRCVLHSGVDFVGSAKGFNLNTNMITISGRGHYIDHVKHIELV